MEFWTIDEMIKDWKLRHLITQPINIENFLTYLLCEAEINCNTIKKVRYVYNSLQLSEALNLSYETTNSLAFGDNYKEKESEVLG